MTPVTEFVISRKKWLRGGPSSWLLRTSDGKQCCVGIYLTACGVPDNDIARNRIAAPAHNPPAWLLLDGDTQTDISQLYRVNDLMTDYGYEPTREARIAELFARNGVTVSFED